MEVKHTQESTEKSNIFQIPIKNFESDMDTESSKEKKKEILELFTTYNKLRSEEEFDDIIFDLHYACREGDLEKIKIFLSETIEDSTHTLKFKIDKKNQTASLFKVEYEVDEEVEEKVEEVNIPRTIEHESTEYLITSIIGTCCDVKTVKISKDSAIKTIYKDAFSYSDIDEIYFPTSLKELKEGWCHETKYLKKIIISPSNGQFEFREDKYLVGKSDENNDEFDNLLFVRRDLEDFSIPSNIKIISSYAFQYSNVKSIFIPSNVLKICEYAFSDCNDLLKVEIPTNSNLQTIESHAFCESNIESIFIPSNVSKICEDTFQNCKNLTKVEIPTNSNLQTIELGAFYESKIESIYFPASLKELKEGWCCRTKNLKKIIVSPSNGQFEFREDKYLVGKSDENNNEFDNLLFVRRDLEDFSIPSNIKIISPYAFNFLNIQSIFIPSNVLKICEYAFFNCAYLTKVEIPTDSNLQTIESGSFSFLNIESFFIPSKVLKICKFAFLYCLNMTKVEIPTDSNLKIIESDAFSHSNIESIFIPSKVSEICEYAFSNCTNLQIIEISEESELKSFPFSVSEESQKFIIMIPSSLRKLIK